MRGVSGGSVFGCLGWGLRWEGVCLRESGLVWSEGGVADADIVCHTVIIEQGWYPLPR